MHRSKEGWLAGGPDLPPKGMLQRSVKEPTASVWPRNDFKINPNSRKCLLYADTSCQILPE